MKTSITISTLLLLVISTIASAQKSNIGIIANTSTSNLNYGGMNDALKNYKESIRGIRAGLSWQAGVSKNFSVVTQAYYERKGGALKEGNALDGAQSTLKLNTIEVPVLARIHAGRFYFNAGPYANYIFSGKRTSDTEASQAVSFANGPDGLRRWEAGFQGGAGYEFNLKKKRMAIDVRYSHGVTSIAQNSDVYTRTFSLNIILLKPLKGRSK